MVKLYSQDMIRRTIVIDKTTHDTNALEVLWVAGGGCLKNDAERVPRDRKQLSITFRHLAKQSSCVLPKCTKRSAYSSN
jgi:hypothetical protein